MSIYKLNLQLFNEGGGGATGGDAGAPGGEQGIADPSQKETPEKVVYGIQENTNTEPEQVEKSTEKAKPTFDELIKGEYKADYDKRVQDAINRRFKENSANKAEANKVNDLLAFMGEKYGLQNATVETVMSAIQNDTAMIESMAEEKGLTVEQFKEMQKLQRENAVFKQQHQDYIRNQQAQQKLTQWRNEESEMKATYPNFSLDTEISNPEFAKLLQAGISVRHAYNTIHFDTLLQDGMHQTATQVKEQVTNNIKSRGMRPVENGINQQQGVVYKQDVNKLTSSDFKEIAERVARGEKISF